MGLQQVIVFPTAGLSCLAVASLIGMFDRMAVYDLLRVSVSSVRLSWGPWNIKRGD